MSVLDRWSDAEAAAAVTRYAAEGVGEDLALRTYSARLLGADPALVLHGGGNTSVKTTVTGLLGETIPVLCVKGSGWDLATIEPPATRRCASSRCRPCGSCRPSATRRWWRPSAAT